MAYRTLAAWLLFAALGQASAGPSSPNAIVGARLKAASGQQGFCGRFSQVCAKVCKKQKVTRNLCSPSSGKLSDYSCVCSTVDHTQQVLVLVVRDPKPITKHITRTTKVTKTVRGKNGRPTLTTSTRLTTIDITETAFSTPTSFVDTLTPSETLTLTSQDTVTDSVTWTSISTDVIQTITAAGVSTFYDVTGPYRRALAAPTPAPAFERRQLEPRKPRANQYILASKLSAGFCKKFTSQCASSCRGVKSTVANTQCSSTNDKSLHTYSFACVCKNGRTLTNDVVNDLVPKRMIVSQTADLKKTRTSTLPKKTITRSVVTTIQGTVTTLQVAATVLATSTAPTELSTTTYEAYQRARVQETIATEQTTKSVTQTVPMSKATAVRANLLTNGGFETGPPHLPSSGGSTLTLIAGDLTGFGVFYGGELLSVRSSPPPYAGRFSLVHFGGGMASLNHTFDMLADGDYQMGCWVLTDSPETAIFNLDATTASSSASQSDLTDQITPNQWSRVMWPFHAIGETTVYFNLWKNSPGSWRIDNCWVNLVEYSCC